MKNRAIHFFFVSSAILLFCTALAKLYSATGSARILLVIDPLVGMANQRLMLGAELIEIAVGMYLALEADIMRRGLALFWLSSNFMFYRIASEVLNVKLCPCLGTLTQNLPFSEGQVAGTLVLIVLYFFFGSGGLLLREWSGRRPREIPAEFSLGAP